jgi:hypothetical protein
MPQTICDDVPGSLAGKHACWGTATWPFGDDLLSRTNPLNYSKGCCVRCDPNSRFLQVQITNEFTCLYTDSQNLFFSEEDGYTQCPWGEQLDDILDGNSPGGEANASDRGACYFTHTFDSTPILMCMDNVTRYCCEQEIDGQIGSFVVDELCEI